MIAHEIQFFGGYRRQKYTQVNKHFVVFMRKWFRLGMTEVVLVDGFILRN